MAPLDMTASTTVVVNVSMRLCVTNRPDIATGDVNQGSPISFATTVRSLNYELVTNLPSKNLTFVSS